MCKFVLLVHDRADIFLAEQDGLQKRTVFQSIENFFGVGWNTLHISMEMDNLRTDFSDRHYKHYVMNFSTANKHYDKLETSYLCCQTKTMFGFCEQA